MPSDGPEASARTELTTRVKTLARDAGFQLAGITSAEPFADAERIALERLRRGLMDGLPWYHESRVKRGCRPQELLPEVRSIIALGVNYRTAAPPRAQDGAARGRVSRYAWGDDYHKVMERRAAALIGALQALGGDWARFYVDYGPMLDRAVAARAGLGWFGKNTNLLTPGVGSWTFLAEILTNLDLEPDEPLKKSCGECTACLPACPTGALPTPYVLDNTRCISYQTIENRGAVPRELRQLMGGWVFGCDICQEVCPVNLQTDAEGDASFSAASLDDQLPDLVGLLGLTEEQFKQRYRGSPVRRTKLSGLQRNACIALGNARDHTAVPDLVQALREASTLVRGHAAWALGRIGGEEARSGLASALEHATDDWVREEIEAALAGV